MRVFFLLYLGLLSLNGIAQVSFPKGCKSVLVQGDSVTLNVKKGNLVLIHSLTKNDIWLTHLENESKGANAGWTSRIQSDHWSALALDKPSFKVTCVESKPGHEQQIPCEGMIGVCQWKKIKIHDKGTFWVSEDLTLSELITALADRGVTIPSAKG